MPDNSDFVGQVMSPGGFIFGVQGWTWGEPRPRTITFFLDGTAMVCDQHGRPIKGTSVDGKEVKFATTPPLADGSDKLLRAAAFASHARVCAALEVERIDWRKLTSAGWPQLPYEMLKTLTELPPTPAVELQKIRDPQLRKDALRMRREFDDLKAAELRAALEEADEAQQSPPQQVAQPSQ